MSLVCDPSVPFQRTILVPSTHLLAFGATLLLTPSPGLTIRVGRNGRELTAGPARPGNGPPKCPGPPNGLCSDRLLLGLFSLGNGNLPRHPLDSPLGIIPNFSLFSHALISGRAKIDECAFPFSGMVFSGVLMTSTALILLWFSGKNEEMPELRGNVQCVCGGGFGAMGRQASTNV